MDQPGPLSSLTTEEVKLLGALTRYHAQAAREVARWVGFLHQATVENDRTAFVSAQQEYQAALQYSRECQTAVRLLREVLLRGKGAQGGTAPASASRDEPCGSSPWHVLSGFSRGNPRSTVDSVGVETVIHLHLSLCEEETRSWSEGGYPVGAGSLDIPESR